MERRGGGEKRVKDDGFVFAGCLQRETEKLADAGAGKRRQLDTPTFVSSSYFSPLTLI